MDTRGQSFKRRGTLNRRATIFAGDFDDETDQVIKKEYNKNKNDLKKLEKLQIIQYKMVGKPRPNEIMVEAHSNMMIRFLIHFLFTEHDHKMIELFDGSDPIFKVLKMKPIDSQAKRQ